MTEHHDLAPGSEPGAHATRMHGCDQLAPRTRLGRARRPAWRSALATLSLAALGLTTAQAQCPPEQAPRPLLRQLAAADWRLADEASIEPLALALLPCLASPDPELRDELAFSALSRWLRDGKLSPDAARALAQHALEVVDAPDGQGFDAPFAILLLAEVARVDRQQPLWTAAQREQVLTRAERFLSLTRDYRGFDAQSGWRHAVAHGADLLMQLAINPALDKTALDRVLAAVAAQVAPSTHFYVFGEGERLMRPVFFVASRGLHDAQEWDAWLVQIGRDAALQPGEQQNAAALARRHNAKAFLLALYLVIQEEGKVPMREMLRPAIIGALKALR